MFLGVESFAPKGRLAHSSILLRDKLYYFGGSDKDIQSAKELFYLDVSQPFDKPNIPWVFLTSIPFGSIWSTVSLNGINNDSNIYLFGGMMIDDDYKDSFTSVIHQFNVNSSTWSIPSVSGIAPERRREIKAVGNNGRLYIFGGNTFPTTGSPTFKFFNDMVIFDTIGLSWTNISSVDAPSKRALYTATLLTNGFIVYIGGYEFKEDGDVTVVDLKQIYLYDTNSLTWSLKVASFASPIENRVTHTAVLAPDGKIIIYGGSKQFVEIVNARAVPDIAVLDTRKEPFEWDEPKVTSNIGSVPSLTAHTADLVGYYMIVAFGNITKYYSEPLSLRNSDIYIMDIRNFTWVNSFDIAEFKIDTPKSNNVMKIIIITISSMSSIGILSICGILFYRWQKIRRENHAFEQKHIQNAVNNNVIG
ncbi:6995_t:CDS:2 [Funneliformis geosporum]|nr:6995_t:CDS:2 [Funneliformis geosporum]